MCILFLSISSVHHALDRVEGRDLGTCFSAASWISWVRKIAALFRLVWLSWRCRLVQVSLVCVLRSFRCLAKAGQSAFFQFHRSVGGFSKILLSSEEISNRINSWSEEVGLSSSIAQLDISGVMVGEEKVRSKTEDP
jgi:hypothetical protein